jgi:hypothetical protein
VEWRWGKERRGEEKKGELVRQEERSEGEKR